MCGRAGREFPRTIGARQACAVGAYPPPVCRGGGKAATVSVAVGGKCRLVHNECGK